MGSARGQQYYSFPHFWNFAVHGWLPEDIVAGGGVLARCCWPKTGSFVFPLMTPFRNIQSNIAFLYSSIHGGTTSLRSGAAGGGDRDRDGDPARRGCPALLVPAGRGRLRGAGDRTGLAPLHRSRRPRTLLTPPSSLPTGRIGTPMSFFDADKPLGAHTGQRPRCNMQDRRRAKPRLPVSPSPRLPVFPAAEPNLGLGTLYFHLFGRRGGRVDRSADLSSPPPPGTRISKPLALNLAPPP